MKKLLQEEKNRSDSGSSRLMETQSKLSQVLKDYADATEELRQKEQKKRVWQSLDMVKYLEPRTPYCQTLAGGS